MSLDYTRTAIRMANVERIKLPSRQADKVRVPLKVRQICLRPEGASR